MTSPTPSIPKAYMNLCKGLCILLSIEVSTLLILTSPKPGRFKSAGLSLYKSHNESTTLFPKSNFNILSATPTTFIAGLEQKCINLPSFWSGQLVPLLHT